MVWEEDKPETAIYTCENGCVIEESKKYWMLKNGEWKATQQTKKIAGFHLNEIYSTDKTNLSKSEKKELKQELRILKEEVDSINQKSHNGHVIYISTGGLIIVILLLIILL